MFRRPHTRFHGPYSIISKNKQTRNNIYINALLLKSEWNKSSVFWWPKPDSTGPTVSYLKTNKQTCNNIYINVFLFKSEWNKFSVFWQPHTWFHGPYSVISKHKQTSNNLVCSDGLQLIPWALQCNIWKKNKKTWRCKLLNKVGSRHHWHWASYCTF